MALQTCKQDRPACVGNRSTEVHLTACGPVVQVAERGAKKEAVRALKREALVMFAANDRLERR